MAMQITKKFDVTPLLYYNVLQEGCDMTISIRFNEKDTSLIKDYAALHNISVSEFVRKAVLERIEDEIDLRAYNKAMEEYKSNPVTYTLDEIEQELDEE